MKSQLKCVCVYNIDIRCQSLPCGCSRWCWWSAWRRRGCRRGRCWAAHTASRRGPGWTSFFLGLFFMGILFCCFLFGILLGLFWWNIFIWNLSMSWWKFFWISFLENQMIPDVFPTTPNTPTRSWKWKWLELTWNNLTYLDSIAASLFGNNWLSWLSNRWRKCCSDKLQEFCGLSSLQNTLLSPFGEILWKKKYFAWHAPVRFLRQQIWSPPVPPFSFSPANLERFKIPPENCSICCRRWISCTIYASFSSWTRSEKRIKVSPYHWLFVL